MKHMSLNLTELTHEEVLECPSSAQILVFNPHTKMYSLHFADKNCPARNKFAVPTLRYFLFNIGELPRS